MFTLILVLYLSLRVVNAYLDPECSVDGPSFTGLRVQRELLVENSTILKRVVVSVCSMGRLQAEGVVEEPLFNNTLCVHEYCFRLVRRAQYASRSVSHMRPGALVGAIYWQSVNEWLPYTPIVVEALTSPYVLWSEETPRVRVPLVRSPHVLERAFPVSDGWSKYFEPYETKKEEADKIHSTGWATTDSDAASEPASTSA